MPSLSPDFISTRAKLAGASQAGARRSQVDLAALRRQLVLLGARDRLARSLPRDLTSEERDLILSALDDHAH